MNIHPAEFAHYLKNSSLSFAEQEALLAQLPFLSENQIQGLFLTLKKDTRQLHIIAEQAVLKRDQVVVEFADTVASPTE